MSVHTNVLAALRGALLLAPLLPDDTGRGWQGRVFTAPTGSPWFRERFLPQSSNVETLGPGARIRTRGLYLLDVFVPAGVGLYALNDLADGLASAFTPAKDVLAGAQRIGIRRVSRGPILQSDLWLQGPITVEWYTDTYNSI